MATGDLRILKQNVSGGWDETTAAVEELIRCHVGSTAPADTTKAWIDTTSTPSEGSGGSGAHVATKNLVAGVNTLAASDFSPALTGAPITITVLIDDPDNAGDMIVLEVGAKAYTTADNTVKITVSESFTGAIVKVLSSISVGTSSTHTLTQTLGVGVNNISAASFTPAITIAPSIISVYADDPDNSGDVYEVQTGVKSYTSSTNMVNITVTESITNAIIKVI